MVKFKIKRKNILITSIILVVIVIINLIVSSLIKEKLTALLLKKDSKYYTATVDKVSFKLIQRSITLHDVFLIPTKESIADLINETSSKEALENITLSSIKFQGIELFNVLFSKEINVNTIVLNDLSIHKFENSKIAKRKSEAKKPFDIDSIYLEKLNGLEIEIIKFNNFNYQVFDFSSNEVTFQSEPLTFESSGIKLEKYDEHLFRLKPTEDKFEIKNIDLNFEDSQYDFSIGVISFDFEKRLINIQKIAVKPQINKVALANTYKFNKQVFDIDVENLKVYNFSLKKLLKGEGIFIDSISVDGLDLNLYKDKRKPYDTDKRPGLPHTGLKNMKASLYVQKVNVSNSNVNIENRIDDKDVLMEISISDIEAQIKNITSIKKYRENLLQVSIAGKLMDTSIVKAEMNFSLRDNINTFDFNGTLASSNFSLYDSALYPTLGLKILTGKLDALSFSATANEYESNGKMTLLYHNLKAEVFKSNSLEENKFLSWTVNGLINEANPKKNKTPREVVMHNERVEYKGLGNYFWKTLQSGIIATIAPGGKQTESSKQRRRNRRKNN